MILLLNLNLGYCDFLSLLIKIIMWGFRLTTIVFDDYVIRMI